MVRINRQGDAVALRWGYGLWIHHTATGVRTARLSDWERLEEALLIASFWSLDPNDFPRGIQLDGATWWIAGRRGNSFHRVERQSISVGALYPVGRLLFDLAGPPLADVRVH